MILAKADLTSLINARHATPHDHLGMHPLTRNRSKVVVVSALVSDVVKCSVVNLGNGE